jgi:hypothetical protein
MQKREKKVREGKPREASAFEGCKFQKIETGNKTLQNLGLTVVSKFKDYIVLTLPGVKLSHLTKKNINIIWWLAIDACYDFWDEESEMY